MRPRGTPPTPRAMSSEMEPVEMAWMSRTSGSSFPSRMMEPLPNWRSTAPIASSIAFSFSELTAMPCRLGVLGGTERRFSIADGDLLVDPPDRRRPEQASSDDRRDPRQQRAHPEGDSQGAGQDAQTEQRPAGPWDTPRPEGGQYRQHLDAHHQRDPCSPGRLGHAPQRQADRHRDQEEPQPPAVRGIRRALGAPVRQVLRSHFQSEGVAELQEPTDRDRAG